MALKDIPAGKDLPNDFNVIIEIGADSNPIKFEVDKETDAVFVDRFLGTSMAYPVNYGFINNTLAGDGDPVDVLVIAPYTLPSGVVIRCRALGMLEMEDESGEDAKILAVPVPKLTPLYDAFQTLADVPQHLKDRIQHFFEHYKDLEKGKWVKVKGWSGIDAAHKEIMDGVERFAKK